LWREFQALPEIFDARGRQLVNYARDSPLRPEFVESTYHLYMATRDPHYLQVGKDLLFALQNRTRVPCGFASIADVTSTRLDDRMDSFFLTETLKYLYLLFDNSLDPEQQSSIFCPLGVADSSRLTSQMLLNDTTPASPRYKRPCIPYIRTIFSTEGHIFFVEPMNENKSVPSVSASSSSNSRSQSVSTSSKSAERVHLTHTCAAVDVEDELPAEIDLPSGSFADLPPSPPGVEKAQHFSASSSFKILEEEAMKVFSSIRLQGMDPANGNLVMECDPMTKVCQIKQVPPRSALMLMMTSGCKAKALVSYPGHFGPDIRTVGAVVAPLRLLSGGSDWAHTTEDNHLACKPLSGSEAQAVMGAVALVFRGECSFVTKARHLQIAGAVGVVVLDVGKKLSSSAGRHLGWSQLLDDEEDVVVEEYDPWEGVDAGHGDVSPASWQVMADDGTGADIRIPVTLVTGKQAKTLYRILLSPEASSGEGITMQMTADESLGSQPLATVDMLSQNSDKPPLVDSIFMSFVDGVQKMLGAQGAESRIPGGKNGDSQKLVVHASHEEFVIKAGDEGKGDVKQSEEEEQQPQDQPLEIGRKRKTTRKRKR